jgi:arginine decarboxylase
MQTDTARRAEPRPDFAAVRVVHTCSGVGSGPTAPAAFDAALRAAGIANYNLLTLSSVVPPNTLITTDRRSLDPSITGGEWGDRLYVVMAERRTSTLAAEVWAGIGWVQDHGGKGLFVEHDGPTELSVRRDIEASLEAVASGRDEEFGEPQMRLEGAVCEGEHTSALVAAVFESRPWAWTAVG